MQDRQDTLAHSADEPHGSASASPTASPADVAPEREGAGEPESGWKRRVPWLAVALVVGFLLNVAWRCWLVRNIRYPAAHSDEDSYLLAARALAGGPGGYSSENATFRRVLYPFLIAPAYWFTSDPFHVYRIVRVINAFINSLTLPLAYLFARRVFDLPRKWSLGLGVLAAALPAVAFYSQYALIDAVLGTVGLVWLLLLHTWLTATTARVRVRAASGSRVAAAATYLLHARGTMVVAVHLFVIIVFALLRRTSWRLTVAAVVTAALVAESNKLLVRVLGDKITTLGQNPGSTLAAAFTTVNGLVYTVTRTIGQFWYLAVGTFGLGALGLVALAMAVWPLRDLRARLRDRVEGARLLVLLTTFVATALIALGSSASLPTDDHRTNYYAYARYIHFLFPIWVMLGVTAVRAARGRRLWILGGSAAALTLVSAAVLFLRLKIDRHTYSVAFDMPETAFLGFQWNSMRVTRPTLAALVLLAVLVVTLSRSRSRCRSRWAAAAIAGAVALNCAMMVASVHKITKPMVAYQYMANTPLMVRDAHLHPGDVVAVSTETQWYLPYNVMREVYWSKVLLFDNTKEAPPAAADIVIAPYGWKGKGRAKNWSGVPEFHQIVRDRAHLWAVWRKN